MLLILILPERESALLAENLLVFRGDVREVIVLDDVIYFDVVCLFGMLPGSTDFLVANKARPILQVFNSLLALGFRTGLSLDVS